MVEARLKTFKFSVKDTTENKSMKERMNAILKGFATEEMSVSIGIDMSEDGETHMTFFQKSPVKGLKTFFNA